MPFQVNNRAKATRPDRLFGLRVGKGLAFQNVAVHAHDQHLFVIRAIEDADPPPLGQVAGGAPKKIVLEFLQTRMLKTKHLAALRVDAGHDMANRSVLACRVHGLKHHKQGVAVRRIQHALLVAQLFDVVLQGFGEGLFRPAQGLERSGPLAEVHRVAFPHFEGIQVQIHAASLLLVSRLG